MKVKWSQNFLVERNVAGKSVRALSLGAADSVLEIGPGRGVLTEPLLYEARDVVAVEIDPELCRFLQYKFADFRNFALVQSDFLDLDLERHPLLKGKTFKVVGNLPYAVVSPILQKVAEWRSWSSAVFMVQKEVGERILAAPGGKTYGVLSVSLQARCKIEKVSLVARVCFRPRPQVDSILLRFVPLSEPFIDPTNEKQFFKVVRASFAHRRKTLVNSLGYETELPADSIRAAIERCGVSPSARAETLSVADFKRLSEMLYNF